MSASSIASAITRGITKGVTGGFSNIGHTVDVWLFSLVFGLLLFLVFGTHIVAMFKLLAQWLGLSSPLTAGSLLSAAHVADQGPRLSYLLWTPGSYTLSNTGGSVTTQGAALDVHWTLALVVLYGGLWMIGVMLGVFALIRARRIERPVAFVAPLLSGIVLFATPVALPVILSDVWHVLDTQGLVVAIGHMVGLSKAQSVQWLSNPWWIIGALFGISGSHGLSLTKAVSTLGDQIVVSGALGVASFLKAIIASGTGSISLFSAMASWVYTVVRINILLDMALMTMTTLWSLLLLIAALWLGLSPAWIWIVALDPWSFDLVELVAGLTLRALGMQVGAWIWTAGIVLIDGGAHGPLGLPAVFAGLTPWLAMIWTLIWVAVAWRFWLVPLWTLGRHVQISVVVWWASLQRRMADLVATAGQHAIAWGLQGQAVGQTLAQWQPTETTGQSLTQAGETMTEWGSQALAASQRWHQRAAWQAVQAQWSEAELEASRASRLHDSDRYWSHPTGITQTLDNSWTAPGAWDVGWQSQARTVIEESAEPRVWTATFGSDTAAQIAAQTLDTVLTEQATQRYARQLAHEWLSGDDQAAAQAWDAWTDADTLMTEWTEYQHAARQHYAAAPETERAVLVQQVADRIAGYVSSPAYAEALARQWLAGEDAEHGEAWTTWARLAGHDPTQWADQMRTVRQRFAAGTPAEQAQITHQLAATIAQATNQPGYATGLARQWLMGDETAVQATWSVWPDLSAVEREQWESELKQYRQQYATASKAARQRLEETLARALTQQWATAGPPKAVQPALAMGPQVTANGSQVTVTAPLTSDSGVTADHVAQILAKTPMLHGKPGTWIESEPSQSVQRQWTWEAEAPTPAMAKDMASTITQKVIDGVALHTAMTYTRTWLTEDQHTLNDSLDTLYGDANAPEAQQMAKTIQQARRSYQRLPEAMRPKYLENLAKKIADQWKSGSEASPNVFQGLPQVTTRGRRILVTLPPDASETIQQQVGTIIQTVSLHTIPKAHTRVRNGLIEEYRNGLWVTKGPAQTVMPISSPSSSSPASSSPTPPSS